MVKTKKPSFYDKWTGETVYYWQDYYFQEYLAASKWGYRLKIN